MSQDKTEPQKLHEHLQAKRSLSNSFTDSQGYQWFNLSLNPDKPIIREKKAPTETTETTETTKAEDTSLSTINLEKEFIFYVAHKINTFNKTIGNFNGSKIEEKQFQDILFGQIGQDGQTKGGLIGYIQTQVSSILQDRKLSQLEKNLALDKLRKTIQREADSALQAQFKLPKGADVTEFTKEFTKEFNHNLEDTLAFGKPITIIQINPNNTVDVLETAEKTAHEYNAQKDTTAKLSRYKYDPDNLEKLPTPLYSTYRTDILVPHSKTYKGKKGNVESQQKGSVESQQIKDTVYKINKIAENFGNSPIFYNLFTSIHSNFRPGEKKNEQTPRLKILLKAQDEYNASLSKAKSGTGEGAGTEAAEKGVVGKKYFFTLNIPTNGFGYEPSPDSFSSEAKEMALRNDIAIAMILGTTEKKASLIQSYNAFLDKNKTGFITGSSEAEKIKEEVTGIKNSQDLSKEDDSLRKTLALLFKNNLHYKHEYARLTQTMALLCEEQSINGCKSGNERTAGILGRVEQAEELKNPITKLLEATDKTEVEKAQEISKAIDEAYDKKGIYGISSDISLSDQGAVSKIETQLPYLSNFNPLNWFKNIARYFENIINTNRAEPSTMDNIQNSKTGSMQAHKVKGFDEEFFSKVGKLGDTKNLMPTPDSSHNENPEINNDKLNRILGHGTGNSEFKVQKEETVQETKKVTDSPSQPDPDPEQSGSSFHPH